ncbi:MAG: hypothetical protein ACREHD_28245 [Pirellulales bacterium]
MRILLTGDFQLDEFAGALAEMKRACEVVSQSSVTAAAEWLQAGEAPVDLIVVAQTRPGQVDAAAIESLRRAAPLAPIVGLLGSWCEGEMRSGFPWPGVPRVYWHQWPSRFSEERSCLAAGKPGTWTMPLTATPEERLLSSVRSPDGAIQGLAAVVSRYCEIAEWLAAACRQTGMSAIVLPDLPSTRIDGIDIVLWDAGLPTPRLIDDFGRLATCFAGTPVLVLLDFPRSDDVRQLSGAGAAAVLAKPLLVADLIGQIEPLLLSKKCSRG